MDDDEIIEELWAREQIRDCLYRYARGIDRYDVGLTLSCFHDDATVDYGIYKGNLEGATTIFHSHRGPNSHYGIRQHVITNALIERSGAVAHVESYLYNPWVPRARESPLPDVLVGGRFIDRFECREGRWAITHRRVVYDYSRVRSSTPRIWDNWPNEDILLGRPDHEDPLYDTS